MKFNTNTIGDTVKEDNAKNLKNAETATTNAAIEDIRRMFVDELQVGRIINDKQTPAKRAAFVKQHGVVYGTFKVLDNIPKQYQVGIFKPGSSYPLWARYSSDIPTDTKDKNSTVGIGIKLFDVPGGKVIGQGTTLDFVLQNTEVFFAKDAEEMAEFKKAAMAGKLAEFEVTHPELAAVLDSMSKEVKSVLTEPLWSCIPFKFGENNYCKFKVDIDTVANPDQEINLEAKDYLALDLADRLMKGDATLNFYVQLRNNSATQSIISARSLWNESEAIPYKVATLTFPKQNINARKQEEYGESLAFNIWRTLPELEPVGSIAEARKVVYGSSATVRRDVNGQSIGEPSKARKTNFSGYPIYQPTTETPWPVGTLGNATENFRRYPEHVIQINYYRAFNEITVSGRDMGGPIYINRTIDGKSIIEGISFSNSPSTNGKLRIVFEKNKMKKVSFDLLSKSTTQTGGKLKITVHKTSNSNDNVSNMISVIDVDGRVDVELLKGDYFDLIIIEYNQEIASFNLNNFIMTYI